MSIIIWWTRLRLLLCASWILLYRSNLVFGAHQSFFVAAASHTVQFASLTCGVAERSCQRYFTGHNNHRKMHRNRRLNDRLEKQRVVDIVARSTKSHLLFGFLSRSSIHLRRLESTRIYICWSYGFNFCLACKTVGDVATVILNALIWDIFQHI